MANYECKCRSNYFKVKDLNAFEDWCSGIGLEVFRDEEDLDVVAFGSSENGIPSDKYNETDGT